MRPERKQRKKRASEAKHARVKELRQASPRRNFPPLMALPLSTPRAGEWLLTTRPGAEQDLLEELAFTDEKSFAHRAGPSLICTAAMPHTRDKRPVELAFARQGFLISHVGAADAASLAGALATALRKSKPQAWALDGWVPDHDATNPLAHKAEQLTAEVLALLPPELRAATRRRRAQRAGARTASTRSSAYIKRRRRWA